MSFEITIGDVICTFNDPLHVATNGVLNGNLGRSLMGEIVARPAVTTSVGVGVGTPPNHGNLTGFGTNIGADFFANPRQDWYYRENPQDPLVGPMSFLHAERGARYLSELEDRSGLAELCTFVGNTSRGGDPANISPKPRLFVVFMFINGKRTLGGRTAQYHSDNGLPPSS